MPGTSFKDSSYARWLLLLDDKSAKLKLVKKESEASESK